MKHAAWAGPRARSLLLAWLLVLPLRAGLGATAVQPASSLADRSGELRAEIAATFKQLRKSHELRFAPQGGSDVAPVVLKYIPLGTPMVDAEAILKGAGYVLSVTPDGHMYARAHLGTDFPRYTRSELEIVLTATDVSAGARAAALRAWIYRKPVTPDGK